ncbi:MAG: beta-lactamase family protein, partial [Kiritimatiellae bacterium]|nr:beta-lactamase family protein [Kiritimatiellia bacterium]
MKIKNMMFLAVAFAVVAAFGETTMEKALKPWVESGELPGAISVLYNNGVEEVTCVGYADVATKRPITVNDAYMQCSQTKGFCGVTIAKLVEEGKISLDDPVSKYLPEFKTLWVVSNNTNGTKTLTKAKNVLTVRMVMNHTGGFPFELPAKDRSIPGGGWTGGMPLRSVAATAASMPLLFEPGTKVQYSNTGIDIGGAIVQTVTGMKWEEYLKKTVLEPLGMNNSTFWPTEEMLKTQIESYMCVKGKPAKYMLQHGWQQRPYNDDHVFASPGAGLWTTVSDQL